MNKLNDTAGSKPILYDISTYLLTYLF